MDEKPCLIAESCHQQESPSLRFCPMREEFAAALSNERRVLWSLVQSEAAEQLVGWVWWAGTAEPSGLVLVMFVSIGWSLHPVASLRGRRRTFFFYSSLLVFFSLLTVRRRRDIDHLRRWRWRRPPPSKEWALDLKAVPGKRRWKELFIFHGRKEGRNKRSEPRS